MKFDMGRAWSDAVAMLGANRDVVLVLAGVFFFLPYVALMLLLPAEVASLSAGSTGDDPEVALQAAMNVYAQNWWAFLLLGIVQAIGMLGLVALLTDRRRPTVAEALGIGAKSFLPYFAAQILQALAILLILSVPFLIARAAGAPAVGLLLGLLAAVALVYVLVKFSLTLPVIVIEGRMNPVAALGRSWSLTKGNSLRLFLFYVLLLIVLLVVSLVFGMIVAMFGIVLGGGGAGIVSAVLNGLFNLAAVTLMLAIVASIHRQLAGASPEKLSETFE